MTYGKPYSSMDFFTAADSCSSPPAADWAVAAAGGTGYHPSGAACWYRIDHSGGWTTSYYHLRNTAGNGSMTANGKIGTIGCETCVGGFASGPHVHFSLLYNGAYVDLEGVQLSGWTVHSGNGDYQTGTLERKGVQLKPYSSVLNEGVAPGTVTPTPSATTALTATPTATATATPTATPTATATWDPELTPTVTSTATATPSTTATPTSTSTGKPDPTPTVTTTPTATLIPTTASTPTATHTPPLPSPIARFVYPQASGLIRTCPVTLVAEVDPSSAAGEVRFWARYGGALHAIGADTNGSDGWQTTWDCQDTADGAATLSLSVMNGAGQEVISEDGATLGDAKQILRRRDLPDGVLRECSAFHLSGFFLV